MILIDKQELRSRVPGILRRMGVPVEITTLKVGDYIIGDIAVERKTIEDYLQSKIHRHLDKQLYELSFNFKLSYLIVEGIVSEALMKHRVPRAAYISSLVGSSLKRAPDGKQGQVITVNVETSYDTALFLKSLHDKVEKGDLKRLPKIEKFKANPNEWQLYVVEALPDIGEVKAENLLKKFKTLRNLFNATKSELMKVPGIGEKIATSLYTLFNLKYLKEGE